MVPADDPADGPPLGSGSTSTRIRAIDILCSREQHHMLHRGNRDFEVTMSAFLLHHPDIDLESRPERDAASQEIVRVVRQRDGRFLAKTRRGTWKDVGDEWAARWVAMDLRRMANTLEDDTTASE